MKKIVYYTQTDAVAELNRVMRLYDGLVAEYNELLGSVKAFMAVECRLRRIQQARLARVEVLEKENDRLLEVAQYALAWREENNRLLDILQGMIDEEETNNPG